MADARFQDGEEGPLRILAQGDADVPVLSALLQDAVFAATEARFDPRRRRFAMLLNRFRWEDRAEAERAGRAFERVRSLLTVEDVRAVRHQGLDRRGADVVLSLLSVVWEPGQDGTGRLILTLSGDGAIALDVEVLDLRLEDVTKPYLAPSRRAPDHQA